MNSSGLDSSAESEKFTDGDFAYKFISEDERTVQITRYTGSAKELALPDSVVSGDKTYTVASVAKKAFNKYGFIGTLTIPESILVLEKAALSTKQSE